MKMSPSYFPMIHYSLSGLNRTNNIILTRDRQPTRGTSIDFSALFQSEKNIVPCDTSVMMPVLFSSRPKGPNKIQSKKYTGEKNNE